MSNISAYSQTAASNNAAPPNGWPEGQAPSTVNDCAREMMAGIARWYAHLDASLTTTGSSNAYVLSTGSSHAALADIGVVVFKANHANTGAATIAIDGLSSKAIQHRGAALVANMLLANQLYAVAYNTTTDAFDLLSSPAAFNALIATSLVAAGLTYPTTDGTSGQYLTTNGAGVLSFANAAQNITRSARTSNTILAAGDKSTLVDITSGTFTQTITAAATLGSGWYTYIRNSGTGDVTIDPNASETIDGVTSFIMYPGETRLIQCDGSAFYSVVLTPFFKRYAASGAFAKPPGYKSFGGVAWSGGASGARGAGANIYGGPGGGCFPFTVHESLLGASETVTVGAGGASRTTDGAPNSGGDTSFGSLVVVLGASASAAGAIAYDGSTRVSASGSAEGFAAAGLGSSGGGKAVYGGATPDQDANTASGSSLYGGGAGGSVSGGVTYAAGTSKFAGNGGAAGTSGNGADGATPAGGGGATATGTQSGAGGAGQLDIWGIA